MATPARTIGDMATVLTIAGSDSGGGAGIQADLKVFYELGCHGTSALTALTAQNTRGVSAIHEVPPEFVIAQIDAVASDIGVDAAKTGMLASGAIVEAVAKSVEVHELSRLVVDPVFVSKHRDRLLPKDAIDALVGRLLPLATVVTPNLYEAEGLLGAEIRSLEEMREAARAMLALGPESVLIKGGHQASADSAIDVFFDGTSLVEISGPRYDSADTHGTGCALSAAIAARLGLGDEIEAAVRYAKTFVAGAIERGLRIGAGFGPVNPAWRRSSR